MVSCRNKSVTLIELIIAIVLVGVIILGINSINIFSHYNVISSDRRAKVQNDVSYLLDHITKQGLKTIGTEIISTPPDPSANSAVLIATSGNTTSLEFFIDANADGKIDTNNDYWIRYAFNSSDNRLTYCSHCTNSACAICNGGGPWVLSNRITTFNPWKDSGGVKVLITGCYDPSGIPNSCGTQDNPSVTMGCTINLPSVSNN